MSPVQLLPAAVMLLGEVVLHVGDVSESGSRSLLFHQGLNQFKFRYRVEIEATEKESEREMDLQRTSSSTGEAGSQA